jgi:hypothetical protein
MTSVIVEMPWSLPNLPGPAGVAILRRERDGVWTRLGDFFGREGRPEFDGFLIGEHYEVAAAPIDAEGNLAPETNWTIETIQPGGTQDAPPSIDDFAAGQDGEFVDFIWTDVRHKMPPDQFRWYELRMKSVSGSGFEDALLLARAREPWYRWKWMTSGTFTFYVAAYDIELKRSAVKTFALEIRPLQDYVDGTETDEDGGGFAGTKTDTEVDTGNLRYLRWGVPANSATSPAHAEDATWLSFGPYEGSYESAEIDLGSTRDIRLQVDMDWTVDGNMMARNAEDLVGVKARLRRFDDAGDAIDPEDESSYLVLKGVPAAVDEKPVEVELWIKHDTTTPIAESYQLFIPGHYYCRYYRMKLVLRVWDRWRRPTFNKLRHKELKKNLKDEGSQAVAGSPGPTTITYAQTFIDTPTLVANHDGAAFVQIVSIGASSATVRVFDDGGTELFTGNVKWIAAGT